MSELDEIKQDLTLEQIEQLLYTLNAEPVLHEGFIICKTICHHGNSHKLYYYDNTKLFRCFTECDNYFDIFQLLVKINSNKNFQLPAAVKYIKDFFNIQTNPQSFYENKELLPDWEILNKYSNLAKQEEKIDKKVEMKIYDSLFLKNLPKPRILNWEQEGIKKEVIKYHNICYNPSSEGIVIPHYNINDQLIGIRERTLIKENEQYGKYKPMILNRKMYNHPLGFNLYNINNSKNHIKTLRKAIVFEGEKSPLLYASYFGQENDIAVACCGNNLSSYQFELLMSLNIDEIVIAFDKQFKTIGDEEWKGWTKKLTEINKKYGKYINLSFMFDKWNLLKYKSAPIDEGKEKFMTLWQKRFRLKD